MMPLLGRDEDCVRADPVLVDQSAALCVVKVDIAVLGDQIDDAVLLRDLQALLCLSTILRLDGENKSFITQIREISSELARLTWLGLAGSSSGKLIFTARPDTLHVRLTD